MANIAPGYGAQCGAVAHPNLSDATTGFAVIFTIPDAIPAVNADLTVTSAVWAVS